MGPSVGPPGRIRNNSVLTDETERERQQRLMMECIYTSATVAAAVVAAAAVASAEI